MDTGSDTPRNDDHEARPPTTLQVIGSVLAAFFGVQSGRNRERDFRHGKALPFIVVGLLLTAIFVAVLVLAVRSIVPVH